MFSACGDNDDSYGNLQEYLDVNSDWNRSTQIIACAAGGGEFSDANPNAPISIFFYPQGTAFDFRYFETDNVAVNESDFNNYREVELQVSDVFNGYLRKFAREFSDKDRWAIVSYRLDGALWTCQPILIKAGNSPTIIDPEAVAVEATDTVEPNFSWNDMVEEENAIYFYRWQSNFRYLHLRS